MRNQGLRALSIVRRYAAGDDDVRAAIATSVRDNPHALFSGLTLPLPTASGPHPSCDPR